MTNRSKILVVLVMVAIRTSSLCAALASPQDYDSFSASQKGVEIIGAIINTSPHENQNVALIKDLKTNKTIAKRVGSALVLDDSYSVTAVKQDYIELQGSRRKVRLYKYGFSPAVQIKTTAPERKVPTSISGSFKEEGFEREEGNIKITEEYRKKMLEKDLPKVLMQAAAEAKMDANGNILGFALYDIEKDSIYAKAGLSDGDVIKSINGEELNSAQGAIKLLNSLKNANAVNFVIDRGGQSLPLNLDVK